MASPRRCVSQQADGTARHRPIVLGHGIDITEQTDAEEKLHTLMRQRESILDSVGDGIYGLDIEGNLTFCNDAGARCSATKWTRSSARTCTSSSITRRPTARPIPTRTAPSRRALHSEEPVRVANEVFWRKDGTSFPVEYVARQLVHDGIVSGTVVAFADVTERRALDRMKDEFISTVSHELRTPLTSLRGASA